MNYKDAGVDIDAGDALVEAIKPLAAGTARSGSMGSIGGFGGLFDLHAAGYDDPVLVSATDGVGTKLRLAIDSGRHDTVGIDLVAMCVNDLIVQGAEPLFFLDYFATGKLEPAAARGVIAGIAAGCKQAGCALIGGETAEMPGMYQAGDYDLAGFAVGAVSRNAVLPRQKDGVSVGDVVLGLESSGVHSNGFSLVRHIIDHAGLTIHTPATFAIDQTLADVLLTPTKIYVNSCLAAIRGAPVHALAHITGGGLYENLPRILPADCAARLDASSWPMPAVFPWLCRSGGVESDEMARTFNCGIGMALIVAPNAVAQVTGILRSAGEPVHEVGRIEARNDGPAVTIDNLAEALQNTGRQ